MYVCKEKTAVLSQQGWSCRVTNSLIMINKFKDMEQTLYFFCISKSKIEAAFRDKVSMSAVELSFLTFDSAKVAKSTWR